MNVVPIGPIHPVLKEPIRLKLIVEGEQVLGSEVEMGYVHRGIERIVEGKHHLKGIHLVERVCGICSYIHTYTFAECIENYSKIEIPEKAKYLRVITCELERIHSHLIASAVYNLSIEHETLAMWGLSAREHVMDLLEMITGNRVNMGYNLVGGVRADINKEMIDKIHNKLNELRDDLKNIVAAFETGPLIKLRGRGIGVIKYKGIMKTRAVGPIARAAALPESDWRLRHPVYKTFKFKPVWFENGDCHDRMEVRHHEVLGSIDLIEQALEAYNECTGDIRVKADVKGGEGEWRNEAHRGEVTYKVATTNSGIVKRLLVRTPTVMNIEAMKIMFKTCPTISDAVTTYTSIDPCISCTERTIILKDKKTGKTSNYSFNLI